MKIVRTFEQAAAWIDEVGIALLYGRSHLPSLSQAMGQKRMVWDATAEKMWEWKDQLPKRRKAWFGKFVRGKGTLIAPRLLVAVSDAVQTPWDVGAAEFLHARGRLSDEARRVAAVLLKEGKQPTLALRYAAGFVSKRENVRFKRAMVELGRTLLVTHFGAEKEEGAAWPSAVYELTPRAFARLSPRISEAARAEVRRLLGPLLLGRLIR
jgi:hypothetical protein